jgi:hypothetical protein
MGVPENWSGMLACLLRCWPYSLSGLVWLNQQTSWSDHGSDVVWMSLGLGKLHEYGISWFLCRDGTLHLGVSTWLKLPPIWTPVFPDRYLLEGWRDPPTVRNSHLKAICKTWNTSKWWMYYLDL